MQEWNADDADSADQHGSHQDNNCNRIGLIRAVRVIRVPFKSSPPLPSPPSRRSAAGSGPLLAPRTRPPAPAPGRRTAAGPGRASRSIPANAGSFARRVDQLPSSASAPALTPAVTAWLCWRMTSCNSCRSPPRGHGRHQQVLRRHVRQRFGRLRGAMTSRLTTKPVAMFSASLRHAVGGEERLRQVEPAVGAVVEGALEPLRRGRLRRPSAAGRSGSGRGRTSARPASGCACTPSPTSRPAPSRTARRSPAGGPAAAGRCPTCAGDWPTPDRASRTWRVDLARVGLPRDGVDVGEAHLRRHESSSRRTFSWSPRNRARKLAWVPVVPLAPRNCSSSQPAFEFVQVEDEVVAPQTGPLADGRQLGRLEVGEAERRLGRATPRRTGRGRR